MECITIYRLVLPIALTIRLAATAYRKEETQ